MLSARVVGRGEYETRYQGAEYVLTTKVPYLIASTLPLTGRLAFGSEFYLLYRRRESGEKQKACYSMKTMRTTIQVYEYNSQRIALKISSYHTLVSCEICIQMEILFAQADFILDQRASTQGFYAGVCCPRANPWSPPRTIFEHENSRLMMLRQNQQSHRKLILVKV